MNIFIRAMIKIFSFGERWNFPFHSALASWNGKFHLSPHENIFIIALINIHYLYNIGAVVVIEQAPFMTFEIVGSILAMDSYDKLCQRSADSRWFSPIILFMKKFLHFDWLRAVQFWGIQSQKKKFSAKKRNSVQIFLDVKFLNYLTTHVYL